MITGSPATTTKGKYPATGDLTKDPDAAQEKSEETISHDDAMQVVIDFMLATPDARALSEKCRDYKDGKQWTSEALKALKKRKQAPIVNNRIKTKHNGLLGLALLRRGDPKAFPRNNDTDSGAANAATDGLRYAADKTQLNLVFGECADNFFCEGYTGSHICVEKTPKGDSEVVVDQIPWDRIFFDVHSRKHDFRDARDKGYLMWMDQEDIEDMFPDAEPEALTPATEVGRYDDTFEDKPVWFMTRGKRRRHMVATHYTKIGEIWYICIYTGSGFLLPPTPSPYNDEYDQPSCPIELEHAYIDRENNRYGELASSLDLQDEINHRRSKMLHLLSQRQTFGNRGSVKDIKKAKMELSKPDGHLEVGQGEFGKDFGILPTGDMARGQLELLQEAKQEIDSQSYNAQLAGEQKGDLSGNAIGKLQQAGVVELNQLFENFSSFKHRVYRQMWNRIRQFWDQEKWVRVTDDQKEARFVGFNIQVTMGDYLQEIMDDESKPLPMRLGAAAKMTMLEQQDQAAQQPGPDGQPQQGAQGGSALQQVIMIKNKPAELDVDIILDESYDVINASQEQLDAILKFGAQQGFDLVDLLNISNIQGKDKLIEKIKKSRAEQAQSAQQDPNTALISAKAQVEAMKAGKVKADTDQTNLETQLLQQGGPPPFKGTVFA